MPKTINDDIAQITQDLIRASIDAGKKAKAIEILAICARDTLEPAEKVSLIRALCELEVPHYAKQ